MKVILIILLNTLALGNAFTPPSIVGRRTSAVYGLGDRLKNLIGRKEDMVAVLDDPEVSSVDDVGAVTPPPEPEQEKNETEKLMQQIKESGVAGVISYALWEVSSSSLP